jgi:predicted MPP superfamily phosphohydrolase
MKASMFIIFFSIVLLLYSLLNYLIFIRGLQAIPLGNPYRTGYKWVFFILSASYIVARLLERLWLSPVSDIFTWVGSFWLSAMIYFLLFALLFDIVRLIHYFAPIYPGFVTANYASVKMILLAAVLLIVAITVIAGYINAITPRINRLDLEVHKHAGSIKKLHVVMVSDIHMGTVIGPRRIAAMVRKINALSPDLILIAGDAVDEDLAPVIRHNLGANLADLKAPYGVYGITGNHEYIGGVEPAVVYLRKHSVNILRDSMVLVNNSFYIAGREDRDMERFTGRKRKPVAELLQGANKSLPVILLDHQPFNLADAEKAGADLQLSGHTHHGQQWPANYITNAIYELSYGYLLKGNTHFYVSSGYGSWGPPVRMGTRSEIVDIWLTFD